jgi:hypothetical protein
VKERKLHITIAIPAYTGSVYMATMRSLVNDLVMLVSRGDTFTLIDDIGSAYIADCRGAIASNFLKTDSDCLVFVDSDVAWEKGALLRLVDHPVDLVGGVYPYRVDELGFPIKYLEKEELWADPETGLLEVAAIATGFMKISRNCLEKLVEAYPEQYFHDGAKDNLFYDLFAHIAEGDKKYGEDYSFCFRWSKIGGKVWCDPEIKMGHTGNKTFVGHFGNYLRNR